MSPGGRADAARLRRLIAKIESSGSSLGEARARERTPVAPAFDGALGGGLAEDGLTEIVPAAPADGPAATAFALALAARFLDRRPAAAVLIGEHFASFEWGSLYGPGLIAHGLSLSRLLFVSAPDAAAAFWATEEALKSGAPAAVAAEVWNMRAYGLIASRRLLLAARKGGAPALLVLAAAHGQADALSTAATTRFEIAAAPSAKTPAAAGRDLPGPFACSVRLVKARAEGDAGAVAAIGERGARARREAHDPTRSVRLEWRREDMSFADDQDLVAKRPAPQAIGVRG
jgi:protein ImuA